MIDKNSFKSLTPGTKVETNKGFKGVVTSVTNNPFFVVEIDFDTNCGKINKYYYDLHTQGNKWEITKILK